VLVLQRESRRDSSNPQWKGKNNINPVLKANMANARMIRSEKGAIFLIREDISLRGSVIPGLIRPALACPVLDTGCLIRGNPVPKNWFPAFAGTTSVFPLEFTP